jgi:hypothetical protein
MSLVLVASLSIGLVASQAQVAPIALDVEVLPSAEGQDSEIVLTNTGPTDAVAWVLRITRPDGTVGTISRDSYRELLLHPVESKVLIQGTPTRVRPISSTQLRGGTITPVAVVYANRTAVGEPEAIEQIFASRRQDAQTYTAIIALLKGYAQKSPSPQDMVMALDQLRAPTGAELGRSLREQAAENLARLLKSKAPREALQSVISATQPFADAANLHSQRQ